MSKSFLLTLALITTATPYLGAEMKVTLTPSIPSPAPIGTLVTWTATASGASEGTLWYRFRYGPLGGDLQMIRDYGPGDTLDWTTIEHEGAYNVEVSVRNKDTGETAEAMNLFVMQSRVAGGLPVVNSTSHPLVFLFSAPACEIGSRMRVDFRNQAGPMQHTPWSVCTANYSMNFYIAGLLQESQYFARYAIDTTAGIRQGRTLSFSTGNVPVGFPTQTVTQAPDKPLPEGILLQSTLVAKTLATDLAGNLVWYYPGTIFLLTRPEPGGYFLSIGQDRAGDQSLQFLREFDLTGRTVLETNAARVSEQLTAMGKRPISAFHHEARLLPNGRILALATVEQILTDVQGPGPVNVLGDMIIVFDSNLQVLWTWDTFDHLDPTRMATLYDNCDSGSCPPTYLAPSANDWVHGNCVQETPDGNLIYSSRAQDWLIKIDYEDGKGSGNVIWRLGKDGDFQFISTDPYPWFSHQHDTQYEPGSSTTIDLFDNGNVRNSDDPNANSRGQVLRLDEKNRTAELLYNVDLGIYSFALGAAQRLADGNYHFDMGYLSDGTSISREIDRSGQTVYEIHIGSPNYRSFRMRDIYTPPPEQAGPAMPGPKLSGGDF